MPRPVVVFLDAHDPEVRAVIAAECPPMVELRMATSADPADRPALARGATFFVGGISAIPASLMDAAPGLRLIQKWGIGVDKIDLAAARARGIPVAITAGANAVPVAEFTLLLMLAVLRRLPEREAQLRGGEWHRARGDTRLQARQLRGRLVALVGLGAIGRQVAKRLQAFDTQVRYFDIRRPAPAEEQALGVSFQELDPLLAEADIVSLHVPYTRATRTMLSRERIARLRPGAIVINTARGEIVDEAALAEALESGALGGAGIDVFGGEPPPPDHPLLRVRAPGLVLAPHVAGAAFDNVANVARHAVPEHPTRPGWAAAPAGGPHLAGRRRVTEARGIQRPATLARARPGWHGESVHRVEREVPMRLVPRALLGLVIALALLRATASAEIASQSYALPAGGGSPHDVAVGADGIVWYTAQRNAALGRLDPATGKVDLIALGAGAAPHGVIIGPDGAPWITEGGTNAIVRVDPRTREVTRWPLPEARGYVNLNTATFDKQGRIWFTGQNGIYGRLDPKSGAMQVWDAPRGRGPYGITTTPDGAVYYASLAGSHIARVDVETGAATVIEPPTKGQGARRVWSDSRGQIWVSEWNAGQVSRYDPRTGAWKAWRLPGDRPQAYAVYVDEQDKVWLSEWSANAMVRFDPDTERFEVFPSDRRGANVRQILGRPGEVWVPESGVDRLIVFRRK